MKMNPSRPLALLAIAGAVTMGPAQVLATDGIRFGAPTVLSQQGQRLKVVVPVASTAGERATASTFMVRETEVPRGHPTLPAQDFIVMRPAVGDYVVFQSGDVVTASQVSLIVSVAGDPDSPYRMDLQVPDNSASSPLALSTRSSPSPASAPTRILRGPAGDPNLPPK
jgi:hypothetical protein